MIRRDLRSALDARRDRERDLEPGVYVQPWGTRLHVARRAGADQTMIVPSLLGGRRTWAPGAPVALASYSGQGGKAIAGNPPAGQAGGAAFAKRVYPPAPPPAEEEPPPPPPEDPPYHVLVESAEVPDGTGALLTASTYAEDGSWVADRAAHDFATLSANVPAAGAQLIRSDPGGIVNPYSYLLYTAGASNGYVIVWDVAASAVYSARPLNSHGRPAALWPLWHDGYVYWAQIDNLLADSFYTYSLYRAPANLASPTLLGSFNVSGSSGEVEQSNFTKAARGSSDQYIAKAFVQDAGSISRNELVNFGWDGSGGARGSGSGWAQTTNVAGIPRPDLAGSSLVTLNPSGTTSPIHTINALGTVAALWPATVPDSSDGVAAGGVVSLDETGGEVLALVRVLTFDTLTWSHVAYRGTPAGTPASFTVAAHPSGALPGAMFIR